MYFKTFNLKININNKYMYKISCLKWSLVYLGNVRFQVLNNGFQVLNFFGKLLLLILILIERERRVKFWRD